MIRREQLRLRTTFQKLLLLSLAAPVAGAATYACSSSSSDGSFGPDAGGGGVDATAGNDSSVGDDDSGSIFGDSATPTDAGAGADAPTTCTMGAGYYTDASWVPDAGPDGSAGLCQYFVDFTCDPGYTTAPPPSACNLYLSDCSSICTLNGGGFFDCLYTQDAGCNDGSVDSIPGHPITITCGICTGVGRRPAGLRRARRACASSPLGGYFAEAAHLEAASVHAFERLRDELRALGAPDELVKTAERSIADEVRHARVTTRLARRYGAEPATVRVRRSRMRSIEAVALENAVEGCVRETFGAAVATWQAAHAEDPTIRSHMRRIAADETRHAALAWAVAAWADTRLDARAKARVARARRAAVRELGGNLSTALSTSERNAAGLPGVREAQAIHAALVSDTWA